MKANNRYIIFILALLLFASTIEGCTPKKKGRPNFLIIVTDDQRIGSMDYMPITQSRIFDEGVTFSNGLITTPFCCPSRSSIFTGMYAHNHNVLKNNIELEIETFATVLNEDDYYTGMVGKYLNSWYGEPRPEYDYWVSFYSGQSNYKDPELNINGEWSVEAGYITYLLADRVIEFLDQASRQDKPFMMYFAPNAPHTPTRPADEDMYLYDQIEITRAPSFNEEDLSDKPSSIQRKPILSESEIEELDDAIRRQLLTLVALDRKIGDILDKLDEMGELDNTVIIYLSDNGKHWGEHRLTSKSSAYEEAVRVPFALRYPTLVPEPYVESSLVANIDICPTLYDLAGINIPYRVDGRSLVELLGTNKKWRDHILLEAWPDRGSWAAIRTEEYIYIETEDDSSEFYDLKADPFQMNNLIDDPNYQSMIPQYQKWLNKEKQPKFLYRIRDFFAPR